MLHPVCVLRAPRGAAPHAFLGSTAPGSQARWGGPVRQRRNRSCVVRAVEEKQEAEQKASIDASGAARPSESAPERGSDPPGSTSSSGAGPGDGAAGRKKNLDVDKVERILRGLQSAMEDERKAIKGERFLELLVSLGGVQGTLAVVAAKLLNLDPFGNFHWDSTDVAVGMALILPILVTDALIMLPEWPADPRGTAARAKKKRDLASPEELRETLEELKEVAKPMSVRERLVAAAGFYQRIRVTQNPGRNLDYWQEAFVVVVAHLADEMLARAVILGGLGLWFRDRLVEADFEFAQAAALGPWAALGALLVFEVARKQRALLNRVQVGAAKVEQDKVTGKQKVTLLTDEDLLRLPEKPEERERAVRVAAQVRDARERTAVANQIDAIRNLLEFACLGTAYAVTNNLAATVAASTASDILFSAYQRIGSQRLKKKEEDAMAKILQKMRDKQARKKATGEAQAAAGEGVTGASGSAPAKEGEEGAGSPAAPSQGGSSEVAKEGAGPSETDSAAEDKPPAASGRR